MSANLVILVIDAMASLRQAAAAQLRALGAAEVFEAGDATQALVHLGEQRINLVIADCDLAGMSGPQLLRVLQSEAPAGRPEAMLVVADAADPRTPALLAAGARQVLARPLDPATLAAALAALPGPAGPAPRRRLLVVDDSPSALMQTVRGLENDFEILTCDNGLRAIELCRADPGPELVLLDVTMPELDGFEVLTRLRQDPRSARIPVIFVSAMTGKGFVMKGLALGAIDYVTKPVTPELLRLRLRNLLRLLDERPAPAVITDGGR